MIKKSILTPCTLALFTAFLLFSCQPDTIQEPYTGDEKAQTEELSFKNLTNTKPILADNESRDILYTRSFNVRNLLYATPASEQSIKIVSYSPQAFNNITVYAKLKNVPERIKLFTLDYINPFTEFEYKVPFAQGAPSYYKTESGKWVEISGMTSIGDVTFSVDSPDPLFIKLKNLKANWNVNFRIRAGEYWIDMNPLHAREYVAFYCNFAYLLSSDEWMNNFLDYEGLYYDYDPSKGETPVYLTRSDRQNLYNDVINRKYFNTGLVTVANGVVGFAGGNNLSVYEGVLLRNYSQISTGTLFHELGHCLGFGHNSNMTGTGNSGKSFIDLCVPLNRKFFKDKKMPFWDYKTMNTFNTYKTYEFKTHYLLEISADTNFEYQDY